jgi:hypothetical protein
MKLIRFLSLFLTLSSLITHAHDGLLFKTGLGVFHSQNSATYAIGYYDTFNDNFLYKLDLGTWTDQRENRLSSPFSSFSLGGIVGNYRGVNASLSAGILILGYPDGTLGSPFSFTEELIIGYQCVGVGYKHISNAGLAEPNFGRDYMFLNFSLPLTY